MRRLPVIATLAAALVATACSGRNDAAGGSAAPAAGSADVKPAAPAPTSCPPGNVIQNGACLAVVTPDKIAAVAQQQTRLDDLAKLLDQLDVVAAPIEIFNGFRQLDPWKALEAKFEQLAALDTAVATLDNAVKTLRTFKSSLGEASGRLGNLKGELDRLMTDTGAARRIEDARATISAQIRAAIEPLAAQVQDTIHNALAPLTEQLSSTADLFVTACTVAKASGGGDKLKDLCTQAKASFANAVAFVDNLKSRPALLFTQITAQLTYDLAPLIDAETRQLVTTAQVKVNQALRLPPAAPPAGSDAH